MEYKNEIIKFIYDNNLTDIFTEQDFFFEKYHCKIYVYLRVSTEKQDFGRQLLEIYKWAKEKNITICIDNIYFDKYTGKKIDRIGYQNLKKMLKSNDYFVTTNLSRLGRNWDEIKKEWFLFDYHKINKIIIDNVNLCVELPNEQKGVLDLSKKMVQDITFSACLYASCQKIEEVRQSTKDGLEKARLSGKILGAPKGKYTTKENFIKTIKLANEICSIRKACDVTSFPQGTFTLWLKKYKKQFNVEKNIDLLPYLEKLDF